MMEPIINLSYYAAMAEIFGAIALIGGALFALIQFSEFRKRRKYQVAAELCRVFSEAELAKAVTLIRSIPDGTNREELQSMDIKFQDAAQIVGMSFETMGLLVYRDIASFSIVQQLCGGLLMMYWRKVGGWLVECRTAEGNPRFGEWIQWLTEQVEAQEEHIQPAYLAYKDWRPRS